MEDLRCTVVICTRNRASMLRRVLSGVAGLNQPAGLRWQLLIVDNGSTDETSAVVKSFSADLPIDYLLAPDPGLSNARNAAVAHARGRYIIWTDDDVVLHHDWLCAYARAFERWPEAAVFGGKIIPRLEPPTPAWFKTNEPRLHLALAARDFGSEPIPLSVSDGILPFGANCAFRRAEALAFPFDPALGVAPGRRLGGEEIAVFSSMLSAGLTGWWLPDAIVHHVIPVERQSVSYLSDYYASTGRFDAMRQYQQGRRPLFGAPLSTWAKAAASRAFYEFSRPLGSASHARFLPSQAYHAGALMTWLAPKQN